MKKVAVYKIVIGDGTLANLDERLLDGLYTDSSISKEIERIRAINGKENKLTQDKKSASMHYNKFRFIILEARTDG
ncbi:hypothetical protein NSQ62_08070 [Solibacillus sp. FSL H8-0523]|uniref:hypothetical protein n=1 Tax=Solibacillus sp. FSL H8-0523 TaxID=2954511 RepID=UPI0031018029